MPTVAEVTADLAAEHEDLATILDGLAPDQWALPTPAAGWDVADQVGHLAYFDRAAAQAINDPEAFPDHVATLFEAIASKGMDCTLDEPRAMTPETLATWWAEGRAMLIEAASTLGEDTRLPWYGPEMGSKSFLTARLMEAWAHGQDVCDAVGATRLPTDRLRHIAQLGVITRGWTYVNRGLEASTAPIRVTLAAPSGGEWEWGDPDANDEIAGEAVDFCHVVTQRRHVDDTALAVTGSAAREWMELAQAFAGGPTDGPNAGRFV